MSTAIRADWLRTISTTDRQPVLWFVHPRVCGTCGRTRCCGTAARPRVTRSLVEDCRLEDTPAGGTAITYTMYFDPPAVMRPVIKALAGRLRANNQRALANLAQRAADREPRH